MELSSTPLSHTTESSPTSTTSSFTCIVFGSTGATGKEVVDAALASNKWTRVTAVTRRDIDDPDAVWVRKGAESKLRIHHLNFTNCQSPMFEEFDRLFASHGIPDTIFYCLGSTLARAGNADKFREFDFGYLNLLCRYIRVKNIPLKRFDLLTAQGAPVAIPAWIHPYVSTKTMCEHTVIGMPKLLTPEELESTGEQADAQGTVPAQRPITPQIGIWQPPALDRLGYKHGIAEKSLSWMSWLIPTVTVKELGVAMTKQAAFDLGTVGQVEPIQYYLCNEIRALNKSE